MARISTKRRYRPRRYIPRRTYKRRPYSALFFKRYVRSRLLYAVLGLLISFGLLVIWINVMDTSISIPSLEIKPSGSYSVLGKPSIDAQFIDQVLAHYRSPASGKGQVLYYDGVEYDIDPAFALAFFMEESTFGTQGVARVTHSLGNIRASADHPSYHGYRLYATWEEGIEDWYRLIAQQYVDMWNLSTVDQIISKYAPNSDNNNERAYIRHVKHAVDTWRSGIVEV